MQVKISASVSRFSPVQKGALAMVFCALLWSTGGLFIKIIDGNPPLIAGIRSFLSAIVLWIFLKKPKFTWSFYQVAAGVVNAVTMLLFVAATKITTAANAILLQYMAPVFTVFLGWLLLKERPRWDQWVSLVVTCLGLFLLFSEKLGGGDPFGNLLALGSAVSFSLYFIFMRKQKDGSPLESVLLSHLFTFLFTVPFFFIVELPIFTPEAIGALLVLGIFQVGLASVLFTKSITKISALSANLIAILEPLLNPLWVFLVIGETPGPSTLVGGAVIIGGVVFSLVLGTREKPAEIPKVAF